MTTFAGNKDFFEKSTACAICHQSMSTAPMLIKTVYASAFKDVEKKSICQKCARFLCPRFIECAPNTELVPLAHFAYAVNGINPPPTMYGPRWRPPRTFQCKP